VTGVQDQSAVASGLSGNGASGAGCHWTLIQEQRTTRRPASALLRQPLIEASFSGRFRPGLVAGGGRVTADADSNRGLSSLPLEPLQGFD